MANQRRWCAHTGDAGDHNVCAHLQTATGDWLPFHRWFIGDGMQFELVCLACAEARTSGRVVSTRELCATCFENTVDEWGDSRGVRGAPEIVTSPRPLDEHIDTFELAAVTIADVAVASDVAETTYVLTDAGRVLRVRHGHVHGHAQVDDLAKLRLPDEPDSNVWSGHVRRPALHVSHDGLYAAVATDFGRFGAVVDLKTGQATMSLDGGEYHPETVPFSLAFAVHNDRPVLVHRTAWNRLDVSDPSNGTLLTEREPPAYQQGEQLPPNYLDYFHGRLFLSPTGKRLLDDGWVWHPVGVPAVWSLDRWLSDNVWESELGESLSRLCGRAYYWNHGLCWLDESRVAVEGIGEDDIDIVPGVRIFNIDEIDQTRGQFHFVTETTAFAGPAGPLFADGDRLFSAGVTGLSVWDIPGGALMGQVDHFTPSVQSRLDGTLVEGTGSAVRRWRY